MMKNLASSNWIGLVSAAVGLAALCALFLAQGFALRGFAWVMLVVSAIVLSVASVVRRSPPSLGQVLDDVDHEPALARAKAPPSTGNRTDRP